MSSNQTSKKKHKWWHFIYGTKTKSELVAEHGNIKINNFWDVCVKCGKQVSDKYGMTTISFKFNITKPKKS